MARFLPAMKRKGIQVFLLFLGLIVGSPSDAAKKTEKEKYPKEFYENLDLFTKVLHYIQNEYVEEVPQEEILQGAIRGMLSTLDPHSSFLPSSEYDELKADTEGRFGGVGIEITIKEGLLTVVSPIEGTPAGRAGIREGDKILKIAGHSTEQMNLADAVRRMRGKRGSKITLTLLREGVKEPFDVVLTRDIIRVRSIRSETLDQDYGYIRIISFQDGTSRDVAKTLRSFTTKRKSPLKGLILDLRNNPGGLLEEGIDVADQFLKKGTIVSTVSRNQEIDKREAQEDGVEPDFPMIVLINSGSASAAEIVAGALQDHHRAILLGTPTFGKGSVQSIFELGQGAALKLTIARYYTPAGRSIQAEGIVPDISVKNSETSKSISVSPRLLREKDLRGHLEGESEKKKTLWTTTTRRSPETKQAEPEDFQKKIALDYLKGWDIFGPPPSE